jgi:tRNA/rRNA methyltransferase
MLPEQQSRLITVLVRARNPSNIGAVARAMHDLGYEHLRVVNDFHAPFEAAQLEAAQKAAVHSQDILANAKQSDSLAEAVADCTLVFGTTAVGARVIEQPLYSLTEAVPVIHSHLAANVTAKVALLFGSEKTGLSNEELSHCHALLTIPMNTRGAPRHLSMNLGQAAAVCLYTIAQPAQPETTLSLPRTPTNPHALSQPGSSSEVLLPDSIPSGLPTISAEEERLTQLLLEVLAKSGYTRRHPANSREPVIRRLVRRMANSANDANVWAGILRQLLHALSGLQSPAEE